MAIDVFWNPSRLGAGEYTKIGSVNWYGLTYEELVSIIATRFHILNDRIYKTDISFIINLLLTEGQTSFEDVLSRNYEFYSNRITRRHQQSDFRPLSIKNRAKLIDINELECVRLLSSLYPTELDFIKTEFTQWMETSYRVMTPALRAAKFLWLCRINKLPVTLNEISRDFGVRTKNIIHTLSNKDYIPPLSTSDYINRISMQLSLPSKITDLALYLDKEHDNLNNTGPVMRACCIVIRAAGAKGFHLPRWKVASASGLTTTGIQIALKRLEDKSSDLRR